MYDELAERTEQKGFIRSIPNYIAAGAIIIIMLGFDDRLLAVLAVIGILVWAGLHPSETMSVLESAAPMILLFIGVMIAAMLLFFVVGFVTVKLGGRFIDEE